MPQIKTASKAPTESPKGNTVINQTLKTSQFIALSRIADEKGYDSPQALIRLLVNDFILKHS